MPNRPFVLFLALFSVSFLNFPPIIGQTSYSDILSSVFPQDGTAGSAIVVKNGEVLFHGASGLADLELNVAAKKEHRFRIGSITKQFTAVSILQLVEKGKLDLQDDITKYIPEFPTKGKNITIEHLLTHTSGIKSYTSMQNVMEDEVRIDYSPEDFISFFKDEPFDFEPGAEFRYNNSGYFLLGLIIERITEDSYANYLQKNIFDPLKLSDMAYDMPEKIMTNRINGYNRNDEGQYVNADYLSMTIPYAAGSLMGTVNDLYKWNKAIHQEELISEESLQKAHTSYRTNDGEEVGYGYGWGTGEFYGNKMVEHGGGINGFLTASMYIAEEDLFVAVYSNCLCADPEDAANRMAAMALGKSVEFQSIDISMDVLKEYEGVYQIGDDDKRVVFMQDGKLKTQRRGGQVFEIAPYAKDQFFYPDSRTNLHFERDGNGNITGQSSTSLRGQTNHATLIDEPLPSMEAVIVNREILEQYVGQYTFKEGFEVHITLDGDALYGQMIGQSKEMLTAKSDQEFMIPNLGVQIIFADGKPALTFKLSQGGQDMVGTRK